MLRTYSELIQIPTFEERFRYLSLQGVVGEQTFGSDRWLNQQFYRSAEWRHIRSRVIARDLGCDLALEGHDIHSRPLIHHMNPMRRQDLVHGNMDIVNPEFLITTTHRTHNAIHYGDESQLPEQWTPRTPHDTSPWRRKEAS